MTLGSVESTINGFRREVASSIKVFVEKYNMDFFVNSDDEAENILDNLFKSFYLQKNDKKIYVIIDEYDHFANELLGFHTEQFKDLVSKNGKVRKWYEILKKGTETVVNRIFVTGVTPITLDSLTSGFNIAKDITRDEGFNEMAGFTEEEILDLMEDQRISKKYQDILLPIMKENYDGYKFSINSINHMYNSNMSLYLLSDFVRLGKLPDSMIDVNIASDYTKLSRMLQLCQSEQSKEIIEQTISGKGIAIPIIDKFNPELEFGDQELISMLFYLGYLTISREVLGTPELKIPNIVMKELYAEFFLENIEKNLNLKVAKMNYGIMAQELAFDGKIEKITEVLKEYLKNLSNRDYQMFDEKYVKILFYSIAMNLKNAYWIKSEYEVEREYPDLLLIPREQDRGYFSIMIEFKYLKKGAEKKLQEKQVEAKGQIEKYANLEEIKQIPNLRKYTVVAVVDKIYLEEID